MWPVVAASKGLYWSDDGLGGLFYVAADDGSTSADLADLAELAVEDRHSILSIFLICKSWFAFSRKICTVWFAF